MAVKLAPDFAKTVCDTQWHSTQKKERHDDGSVTLRFVVDELDEIVWWVMGFGSKCKVLEPKELAKLVCNLQIKAAR